jgi:hypothetical protein
MQILLLAGTQNPYGLLYKYNLKKTTHHFPTASLWILTPFVRDQLRCAIPDCKTHFWCRVENKPKERLRRRSLYDETFSQSLEKSDARADKSVDIDLNLGRCIPNPISED